MFEIEKDYCQNVPCVSFTERHKGFTSHIFVHVGSVQWLVDRLRVAIKMYSLEEFVGTRDDRDYVLVIHW